MAEQEEYLLKFGIDWSNASRETQAFIRNIEAQLDALVAKSASGTITPLKFGQGLAGLQGQEFGGAALSQATIDKALREFKGPKAGDSQSTLRATRAYERALQRAAAGATAVADVIEREKTDQEIAEELVKKRVAALKVQIAFEQEIAKTAEAQAALTAEAQILTRERVALERKLIEEGLARSTGYIDNRAAGTIAEKQRKAAESSLVATSLGSDEEFIKNKIAAAAAEQEMALAIKKGTAEQLGVNFQLEEQKFALQQRLEIAQEAIVRARTGVGIENDIVAMEARVLAVEAERYRLKQAALAGYQNPDALVRAGLPFIGPFTPGYTPGGENTAVPPTWFQRFQARLHPGADRAPESFATGPRFLAQGGLSVVRFAASAAVLYGAINGIREVITNAQELQRVLNQVQAQFNAIGQGDQFKAFRNGILAIARDTGVASKDVAFLAFQLKGAFGDSSEALKNARAGAELVKVTGLSLGEVTDSLTATSKNLSVSFSDLGDKALGVQERFGVQAKETLAFFGDLSPVAKQAGLSLEELAAIAGVAQQRSGQAGSSLAEAFNRVLPQVQGVTAQIVGLFNQAGGAPEGLIDAARQNQTGQVLLQSVRNIGRLSESQKNSFIDILGGRREAQAVVTLVEGYQDLNNELDRTKNGLTDTGKLQDYFNKLQDTLAQKTALLAEKFRQLGQALFEGGLGDGLIFIVETVNLLVTALTKVFETFSGINKQTHGLLGDFLLVVGAAKVLGPVLAGFGFAKASTVVSKLFGGAGAGVVTAGARASLLSRFAGAGGILGALGPALPALAVAGGFQYLQFRGSQQADRNDYIKKLETLSDAEFAARRPGSASVAESIGDYAFGRRSKVSAYNVLEAQRRAAKRNLGGTLSGLSDGDYESFLNDVDKSDVKHAYADQFRKGEFILPKEEDKLDDYFKDRAKLLAAIDKGDKTAIDFGTVLADFLEGSDAGTKQLLSNAQIINSYSDGSAIKDLEAVKNEYEAGLATIGEYLLAVDVQLANLRQIGGNNPDSPHYKEYTALGKERNQRASANILEGVQAQAELLSLSGEDPKAERDLYLDVLTKDKDFKDPKKRGEAAKKIVELSNAILKLQADMASTAEEKARILLAGIPLEPEVRAALLTELISETDGRWTAFLKKSIDPLLSTATFVQKVVERALYLGIGVAKAAKQILSEMLYRAASRLNHLLALETAFGDQNPANISRAFNLVNETQSALDAVNVVTDYNAPNRVTDAPGAAQADKGPTQAEIEQAQIDVERAKAAGDAVALAQLDLKAAQTAKRFADFGKDEIGKLKAEAAIITAQRAIDEAMSRVSDEQEKLAALLTSDPVDDAQAELNAANRALALATGVGERAAARQAVIQASRSVAQVTSDLLTSQTDILIAVANAAGDQLEAIELQIRDLYRQLANADALGLTDPQRNNIYGQIVGLQAQQRDAQLATQKDTLEFQHDMKQITEGQFIAGLEALLQIPGLTVEQIRDIQLEVKRLRDQLGSDYKFNIPTELGLPTLYEVRRLGQTGADYGRGGSTQDNRVITINLTANNVDGEQVVTKIVDEINRPPRYGLNPRIY